MINDKQHGSLLQASVSKGNPTLRDAFAMNIVKLENHFDLQDKFIKTTNISSWKYEVVKNDIEYLWKRLQNIYASPKPLVKMKLNKLLVARLAVSIHAQNERAIRLKSSQF